MDVIFYEAFQEEEAALRRHLPRELKAAFTWKTIQESGDRMPPASCVSIRTQSRVPDAWLGKLRAVLSRTTGYDHVTALARLVPCGYLPVYCSRTVAEQALLLILALLRKLPDQMRQFTQFTRDGLTGADAAEKNLLVVGVGHVGSEMVRLGAAMGMQVRGVDLVERHPFVPYTTIDEGMAWADVIVCAMNLTASNHQYFDRGRLATARRGVMFVNVARGELSPLAAVLELIESGHLGGLALDVFEHEAELAIALRSGNVTSSTAAVRRLAQRSNVILTPHNAFNTRDAVERKSEQSIEQVRAFLLRGEFRWQVPGQ